MEVLLKRDSPETLRVPRPVWQLTAAGLADCFARFAVGGEDRTGKG